MNKNSRNTNDKNRTDTGATTNKTYWCATHAARVDQSTYPRYNTSVRPEKEEPQRTRVTVGGNQRIPLCQEPTAAPGFECYSLEYCQIWNQIKEDEDNKKP